MMSDLLLPRIHHADSQLPADVELALLRRFEPVMRYTQGEQFFPVDVAHYVRRASLWVQRPGEDAICVLRAGHIDLTTLGQVDVGQPDAVHFLKFSEPGVELPPPVVQTSRRRYVRHKLFARGTGRLVRVGYVSRFVDALFNISLFARGRVPGETAASAAVAYEQILNEQREFTYHGRVVREGGWVVVQYWFFYAYNNWRSGFYGANDHEGDWELVSVYLSELELADLEDGSIDGQLAPNSQMHGERGVLHALHPLAEAGNGNAASPGSQLTRRYRPEWVAYASHDYSGDDLRRRWDDPELEKFGEHPVVYAAAGSHANYFRQGEYLTELELTFLQPLAKVLDWGQQFWHNQLRQYQSQDETIEQASNLFRIPFVDYARGDGVTIGPGQEIGWSRPRLLHETEGWLSEYRGLWGLYAHDPFAGEDAPAGPMYNRDRSIRRSWYDPSGWAGLDKVPPPDEEARLIVQQQQRLQARQAELDELIAHKALDLRTLGLANRAVRSQPHLRRMTVEAEQRLEAMSAEVAKLRAELASNRAVLASLDDYLVGLRAGLRESPRAHIQRAHAPAGDEQIRAGRLAEVWAAASIGLMLVLVVGLFYFARHYLVFGLSAMIALFAFVEATFRGRIVRMVTSVTIGLAVVAALILLYEFFWPIMALTVVLIASYLLWDNLRELWA
jgi:hypothetical protein